LRVKTITRRRMAHILIVCFVLLACAFQVQAAKNVILMIGDGMGPNHVKAGSYYVGGQTGTLAFEPFYKCSVRTYPLGGGVTDSAAAATAMATGNKVSNGVISQAGNGTAYTTILEKAKAAGKRTGLVSNVSIVDATPAAFGAHEASRNNTSQIVNDFLNGSKPNVVLGGGSGSWTSTQITTAQSLGYQYVTTNTQLQAVNSATQPYVIGLFASGDMNYEYGWPGGSTQPHLNQMASKALSVLENDPDGFFLMIEDGIIDHASSVNQVTKDVVELSNTFTMVMNWVQTHPDTMVIVAADHETGGLTVTNNGAGVYPGGTWTNGAGNHTATNTPFYVTGANANLINNYMVSGTMENTDVFRLMDTAFNTPVPEPSTLITLGAGLLTSAAATHKRRK